jgi:thiosulfate dehydrogenase [quinone] large subunit
MLGLAGIGVAAMLGIGLPSPPSAAPLMMLLVWVAEWPLAKRLSTGELDDLPEEAQ